MSWFLPLQDDSEIEVKEGEDVTEILGITKYEPRIPENMSGEVCNIGSDNVVKYDIENWKSFPNVLEEGEEVTITEKLHGTFCEIGYVPSLNHPELFEDGEVFVCSKGLGSRGLVFKDNGNNIDNVYVKRYLELTKDSYWKDKLLNAGHNMNCPIFVFGEVFGPGIQDLQYGLSNPTIRIFDIYVGTPGIGRFLKWEELELLTGKLGLETVPVLYKGPYSRQKIDELVGGKTTLGGGNIKEGIVIKPVVERTHPELGRVFLKYISTEYMFREGNVTEYQ